MSKKEDSSENKDDKISVCDVMKNNSSEIIKKLESQIPSMIQQYSDLYQTYLHTFDDLFSTCYVSEKEFFDKLNIDQDILREIDKNIKSLTQTQLEQIEMSSKYVQAYVQARIATIKSFDNFMHIMMESYAKTLSRLNESS